VLFVRKKDEDLRMCINYRVLNKMTVRNEYPLLKIDELLDTLQLAKFFTTLDLDMTYYQIRIKEEDITKTVFICTERHYEFLVMTFGLTNTPATF
jgi:Reverse transcriptase (RNA-dependent DNA polymerase)